MLDRPSTSQSSDDGDITLVSTPSHLPETKILVIATKKYTTSEPGYISVNKDDVLIITNINPKEGWVYGYKKDDESKKGLFPKDFIFIFKNSNANESKIIIYIY